MKFRWFETGLKAFFLLDLVLTYTRVGSYKGTIEYSVIMWEYAVRRKSVF